MTEKTFLLGVGCQKGGTSWLHAYLAAHPQVAAGFAKEFHVFDVRFLPAFRNRNRDLIERVGSQIDRIEAERAPDRPETAERLGVLRARLRALERAEDFAADPAAYARYFADLAADPAVRVVLDVTPSYALLEEGHLAEIKALLEEAGFAVKVVFLLREPVERLHSAWRMEMNETRGIYKYLGPGAPPKAGRGILARARGLLGGRAAPPAPEADPQAFLDFARDEGNMLRSRYEVTIGRLERVFSEAALKYGLYETMFGDAFTAELCGFLGIDPVPGRYERRLYAGSGRAEVPTAAAASLRRDLDPTYRFSAERFGEDLLRSVWRHR